MTTTEELTEQLASMAGEVPPTTEVIELTPADSETSARRTTAVLTAFAEATGIDINGAKRHTTDTRTVLRLPSGGRAVTFHASGAMVIKAGIEPFAELYRSDPGDDQLIETMHGLATELGLSGLVPHDDRLAFERLWRIKAAGSDPDGTRSGPVLCRAIGAYRHAVRDLPVYGRASATLELTGEARLASMTIATRRFTGDGSGATVAKVESRHPGDAARDVAERMARALHGAEEPRIEAQSFRFGYVSLSRRQPQAVLAPVYLAAVTVHGGEEQERSAHIVTVSGSEERFLRLPGGAPAAAQARAS